MKYASVAEWSIAFDCKSNAFGLRGFESLPAHNIKKFKLVLGFFNISFAGVTELLQSGEGFERRSVILLASKMNESVARLKISDEKFLSRNRIPPGAQY